MAGEYQSPTTPGLQINFRSYVVELVCLNMDPALPQRFWKDEPWKGKFARECRGFAKLVAVHGDPDDPLIRKAIVTAIRNTRVKTMLTPSALKRLDPVVKRECERLRGERERLAAKASGTVAPEITDVTTYMRQNTGGYVTKGSSILTRLKAVESHGQVGNNGDGVV